MEIQVHRPQLSLPCPPPGHSICTDVAQHEIHVRTAVDLVTYHLHSIWLFTYSDLKTIVGPSTAFAVVNYLGCAAFDIERPQRTPLEHASRIIQVVVWLWVNLLPFNIDNQRQSIDEDLENKPWRTLPSRRMTSEQATMVMLVLYPMGFLFSIFAGPYLQSLALIGLGIWYNDLGGADGSWILRNFINACGYICFTTGALQIMLQRYSAASISTAAALVYPAAIGNLANRGLCAWLVIIGGIVLSTIQVQDMHDQAGDKRRGRKSMPLVIGDRVTRWTIASSTLFWSCFCPYFWSLPRVGFVSPIMLGSIVAWRTLSYKSVVGDKLTFRIWNVWLMIVYSLPWTRTWLM